MKKEVILEFKDIVKEFNKKRIIDKTSFKIIRGEIFGIIGMSGSGKTTILKLLIGSYQPDEGDILYTESEYVSKSQSPQKSITKNLSKFRSKVGFAPQDPSFYPQLTAQENLYFFGSLYGLPKKIIKINTENLLKLIGLEYAKDTLAEDLSFGMQKRLGIACSLIHKPEILILDEPTADLDPILRYQTWDLIKKINEEGTTIILASHFLEEIESVCDRIGILHKGHIIEQGTLLELKSKFSKSDQVIVETDSIKNYDLLKPKFKHIKNIERVTTKGKKIVFFTMKSEELLHNLIHLFEKQKIQLVSIEVSKPSLIEVFEAFTKRDGHGNAI